MKIGITGADGVIGSCLRTHWSSPHEVIAIGNESDLRSQGEWMERLGAAETIVHLAAQYEPADALETMADSIDMTVNLVRAAGLARRIVFASSMWAKHRETSLGPNGSYYAASKHASEAIVRGWSDVNRRPAISLRLGHYGSPIGTIPTEHELLRIDDAALKWWFDKAIGHNEPEYRVWQAIGRLKDGGQP